MVLRYTTHAFRLASCILLTVMLITGFAAHTSARSFTVSTHRVTLDQSNRYGYISITATQSPLVLSTFVGYRNKYVQLTAIDSANLRSGLLSGTVVLIPDSTQTAQAWISVYYATISDKPTTMFLTLTNRANGESDTITIETTDSIVEHTRPVLTIENDSVYNIRTSVNHTDAKEFNVRIRNIWTSKIVAAVSSTNASDSVHFTTSARSLSIDPVSQSPDGSLFTVTYHPDKYPYDDSISYMFTPDTPGDGAPVILNIFVHDTSASPGTLSMYAPYFGTVEQGSKTCQMATLSNRSGSALTITDLSFQGPDASAFALDQSVSLPIEIPNNSSKTITVCYTAPNAFNRNISASMHAVYKSAGVNSLTADCPIYAYLGGCVWVGSEHDTINMGTVIGGGWIERGVRITNHSGATLSVDSARDLYTNGAESVFTIATTFPFTLAADETKQLDMLFTPAKIGNYGTRLALFLSSSTDTSCTESSMEVDGYCQADSSARIQLFPAQTETLNIVTKESTTTQSFVFTNNLSTSVKVLGVSVKDGTHFSVSSPKSADLPITVDAGKSLTVELSFDAGSNGQYSDSLVITTDHAAVAQQFVLHGTRTSTADVVTTPAVTPNLTVTPNPSPGNARLSVVGAANATLQIYSELGVLIASHENSTSWQLGAGDATGPQLASGAYIVRASGIGSDGRPFVTSKQIVVTAH